jgi:flagellar hook-associated protein 1 FlgK
MSLESALLRATSGIRHTSRQIEVTSQNVANAGVEGYTRKTVAGEQFAGAVRSLPATRDVDRALRVEARDVRGDAAAAALRADVLGPLAQLQGSPADGASLGGLVGALRDGLTELRADPDDSSTQGTVLRGAEAIASRLQDVATAVARTRQAVQDGLRTDVDLANGLLRDVAKLEYEARSARAAGRDDTNALDSRDTAIGKLSELIDITPVEGRDGGLTLILRGGALLPLDPNASPFGIGDAVVTAGAHAASQGGTLPGLTLRGAPLADVPRGGRIGEGLALRDDTLARMGAELDTLATTLAGRLREQGLTLFTDAGGDAPPATGSAGAPGFAQRITVSAQVAQNTAMLRDGTPDVPEFPPNPQGQSGYTALLDRVLNHAFGDKKNATTLHAPIPATGIGASGDLSSSFSPPRRLLDYAAAVTAAHASEAGAAADEATATSALSSQLASLVQRREGVDIDAEMASMVTLQNAYAANARVISVLQTMWDSLLSTVR